MSLPIKSTNLISKSKLILSKHAPEIWVGAGIIAIIGGTILACKASRKLDSILEVDQIERDMLESKYYDVPAQDEELDEDEVLMTEKDYKRERAKIALTTAGDIAREYAPAVLLIAGGIGMIVNGHHILNQRNAALMSAYATLDQSFTEYRARVAQRYGGDVERDIYNGTTYQEEVRTEVDENGKKKKIKEQVPIVGTSVSPYAKFFCESTSTEWMRAPDYNHTFLICQQNAANDKLRRDGYLFLNTVYKMLGLKETSTGAICGWILPEEHDPLHEGDNYVDFGIFDASDPDKRDFVNSETNDILLDFNCQGIIYDKI